MKILTFIYLLFIYSVSCFGQTDSLNELQNKNKFIAFGGANLTIGNTPSTTGWFGASFFVSSKHFDMSGGMGWSNVQKLNLGIGYHLDLRKQFCPFISTECVFSLKRGFVFNEGTKDERHYQVGGAQLLNFGGGMIWHPKTWENNKSIASIFIKMGYRQLLSNYSIIPKDPTKFDNSEINTMYHDLFESRFYLNLGLRWGNFF